MCPLCLKPLQPGEYMRRVCMAHPLEDAQFTVDHARPPIDCRASCNFPVELGQGVFLAHQRCTFLNPFVERGRVVTDGMDMLPQAERAALKVKHYQITALREIASRRGLDTEPAMWYPQTIFRLVNDPDYEDYRRLIMLMGSTASGKTVLSLMAGAPSTHSRGKHLFLPQTYSAVGNDEGTAPPREPLQRRLYIASQLDDQQSNVMDPESTKATYSLVSAIFLRDRKRSGALSRIWHSLPDLFSGGFTDGAGSSTNQFRLLLLYDFAGERFDWYQAAQLQNRLELMTHAAVLLDATSLKRFKPDSTSESVRVAYQRLDNIPSSGVQPCLIVTKLDLVRGDLSRDDEGYLAEMDRDPNLPVTDRESHMLRRWLDESVPWEASLRGLLNDRPDLPVFFVWTMNLNSKLPPCSIGLQRFLLWTAGLAESPLVGSRFPSFGRLLKSFPDGKVAEKNV